MTAKKNVSGKSPARTRMIEVMTMKGLARRTQVNYLASICSLARHWGRAPQALSADEVRAWVIGRIERGLSPRTTNAEISALRLFFADAMGQPDKVEGLRSRRIPDCLPRSIPEADVERLIQGIDDLRYRTATLTAYGAAHGPRDPARTAMPSSISCSEPGRRAAAKSGRRLNVVRQPPQ